MREVWGGEKMDKVTKVRRQQNDLGSNNLGFGWTKGCLKASWGGFFSMPSSDELLSFSPWEWVAVRGYEQENDTWALGRQMDAPALLGMLETGGRENFSVGEIQGPLSGQGQLSTYFEILEFRVLVGQLDMAGWQVEIWGQQWAERLGRKEVGVICRVSTEGQTATHQPTDPRQKAQSIWTIEYRKKRWCIISNNGSF